jgi:hypothetical protein
LGVVLVVIGLASIWAFIEPKYQNAPVDVPPTVSLSIAPSHPDITKALSS